MKRLLILAVAAALVVAGGVVWRARTAAEVPAIMLQPPALDFGRVAGRVQRTVLVRNAGRAPLQILAVSTSCGCTTASIDVENIPPGGAARLAVTFDSAAHGAEPGPASHIVYLRTNDLRMPEAEIPVSAVVVKEP